MMSVVAPSLGGVMQFHNLLCLIVDEADRILEIGFEVRQFSVLTRLQMIAQLNLIIPLKIMHF